MNSDCVGFGLQTPPGHSPTNRTQRVFQGERRKEAAVKHNKSCKKNQEYTDTHAPKKVESYMLLDELVTWFDFKICIYMVYGISKATILLSDLASSSITPIGVKIGHLSRGASFAKIVYSFPRPEI